jgi:predicted AAA+ superfamily ATPase
MTFLIEIKQSKDWKNASQYQFDFSNLDEAIKLCGIISIILNKRLRISFKGKILYFDPIDKNILPEEHQ